MGGMIYTIAKDICNYQVLLINGENDMQDPACGSGSKNRKTQQTHLILEVLGEMNCQVASEQNDATGLVEAFCQRDEALGIDAVFQALQIFYILLERVAHSRWHVSITFSRRHGFH